ncbi:hypothetical protein [Kitasatospora sp. GP82]|uniref:hypothetical protein n=1 Tax=Kitasatospora sp. GP82 TaxID=3035089 RepID=UPI002474D0CA|nr:hypothetical protein [Kitasatospora sp. GP82]MDH6127463.1 ankyrin repeat protein [Kitasatospora sp. GP82]
MESVSHGSHEGDLDSRLVMAVRERNADKVRRLLETGADPDAAGADGLPVPCAAVVAYDDTIADALVDGGADPDRTLPDGTTPLLRADAPFTPEGTAALLALAGGSDSAVRVAAGTVLGYKGDLNLLS